MFIYVAALCLFGMNFIFLPSQRCDYALVRSRIEMLRLRPEQYQVWTPRNIWKSGFVAQLLTNVR